MISGVILSLALVGWSLFDASVMAVQPAEVRISYSSRSNSNMPFQPAVTKGFFAAEGMDVELIQVNARLGATAVLNGDLDFTTTFGRYVFENRNGVLPQMIRYLTQTAEVAEQILRSAAHFSSRNGEISDQDWGMLTEKKKAVDEVRDFSLLREVQNELKIK